MSSLPSGLLKIILLQEVKKIYERNARLNVYHKILFFVLLLFLFIFMRDTDVYNKIIPR